MRTEDSEGNIMGPFGDNFTETLSTLDFAGFAGGFWDSENNGFHFGAREYEPLHGSWRTPDPAGLAAMEPTNPQSWNRYAYVIASPTSYIDPTGLACWPTERAMFGSCYGFLWNGMDLGSNWNEFDVMSIPVVTGYQFVPTYSWATPSLSFAQVNTTIDYGDDSDLGVSFGQSRASLSGGGWYVSGYQSVPVVGGFALLAQTSGPPTGPQGPQQPPTKQPIKPFKLPLPNTPPGKACSKYSSSILRSICNNTFNNQTSNCVRGYLLNSYDPNSGYSPGLGPAHCDAWSSCGWPQPIVWGACAIP